MRPIERRSSASGVRMDAEKLFDLLNEINPRSDESILSAG